MSRRETQQKLLRRAAASRRRRERDRTAGMSLGASESGSHLVAAFAPNPIVFRATGHGTAAIVRELPNGRHKYDFVVIDMSRGGLQFLGGSKETFAPGEADARLLSFLDELNLPPTEASTPEMTAISVWGAYAYSRATGASWPAEVKQTLAAFPRAPGGLDDWVQFVRGPKGLCSSRLLAITEPRQELFEELPAGKDLVIFTEIDMHAGDGDRLASQLDAAEPEFHREQRKGGVSQYVATREYPEGHWNPNSRLPGARQILGTARLQREKVTVTANTLGFAAQIAYRIIQMHGPGVELIDSRYKMP